MSQYTIFVTPSALQEIKGLPGNFRQQVKRIIDELADEPRPAKSQELDIEETSLSGFAAEVRRYRLDRWRILYAISEDESIVDVIAIRKRPPYDYADLEQLLADIL